MPLIDILLHLFSFIFLQKNHYFRLGTLSHLRLFHVLKFLFSFSLFSPLEQLLKIIFHINKSMFWLVLILIFTAYSVHFLPGGDLLVPCNPSILTYLPFPHILLYLSSSFNVPLLYLNYTTEKIAKSFLKFNVISYKKPICAFCSYSSHSRHSISHLLQMYL